MLYTPEEIAQFLVQTYSNAPGGLVIHRDAIEKHAKSYGIDHNFVRSVDLELRPMGYVLVDLLKEQECVVLMHIKTYIETLMHEDMQRAV